MISDPWSPIKHARDNEASVDTQLQKTGTLPRYAENRRLVLAEFLEDATTFAVHRNARDQLPVRDISETLTLAQTNNELALRYEAALYRSPSVRTLEHRDYAEFAATLGVFEHYKAPWLLGRVHETIEKTIAPHLPLPFLKPGTEKYSPYRYWTRNPLHDYSVAATLTLPGVSGHSVLHFVAHLWEGSNVSIILDP